MLRSVTAVILSRRPISNKIRALVPEDVRVLNFVSEFRSFNSYRLSWLMAVARVETEWFFIFDDDDKLPPGFSELLDRLITATGEAALGYTNELIINDAGIKVESKKQPYSQDAHIKDPTLLHHLVLCRTEVAKRAATVLPEGHRMPEILLYFQMAKEGAVWVDEIGYHWHRTAGGMSRWPGVLAAQVASLTWCQQNRALESPPRPPPPPEPEVAPAPVEAASAIDPGELPYRPAKPTRRVTRKLTKG